MFIDGRDMIIEDLLLELRDIVRNQCAGEANVEVLVSVREDAVKVKGFASMSGCDVHVAQNDDGYLLKISGGACNACR